MYDLPSVYYGFASVRVQVVRVFSVGYQCLFTYCITISIDTELSSKAKKKYRSVSFSTF